MIPLKVARNPISDGKERNDGRGDRRNETGKQRNGETRGREDDGGMTEVAPYSEIDCDDLVAFVTPKGLKLNRRSAKPIAPGGAQRNPGYAKVRSPPSVVAG